MSGCWAKEVLAGREREPTIRKKMRDEANGVLVVGRSL